MSEKESPFPIGSVVVLKSGGPQMTVIGFGRYGLAAEKPTVLCEWFARSTAKQKDFVAEALRIAVER